MSGAKIALLLVEPEDTDFGEDLTAKVQAVTEEITRILREFLTVL
jgi:hypothetical protein